MEAIFLPSEASLLRVSALLLQAIAPARSLHRSALPPVPPLMTDVRNPLAPPTHTVIPNVE